MVLGLPVMVVMVTLTWVVLPVIVPYLMPKYNSAIPTMCLMMLVLPLIILELPYSFLIAMGKTDQQNIAVFMGLGCFLLLALGAIHYNLGINSIVVASLVGRIIRIMITYGFIIQITNRSKKYPDPMVN